MCTLHRAGCIAATLDVATDVGILTLNVGLVVEVLLLLFTGRTCIDGRLSMLVYRPLRLNLAWAKATGLLLAPGIALLLLLVLLVLINHSMVLSLLVVEACAPTSEIRNLSLLVAHYRTRVGH